MADLTRDQFGSKPGGLSVDKKDIEKMWQSVTDWISKIGKGGGGGSTVPKEPMIMAEQLEALRSLLAESKAPGYSGELGSYEMTDAERAGQSNLMKLLASGNPEMFNLGKEEIKKVFQGGTYDPYAQGSLYAPYKKQVKKEARESEDIINRQSAMTGGLYSTAAMGRKGELAEDVSDKLSARLAELYDTNVQRRQAMIPTALNAGINEEEMAKDRIKMASTYGSLERILKDQQLKDKYNSWIAERGRTLSALGAVAGVSIPWDVKSVTVPEKGFDWDTLINLASKGIELYLKGSGG